MPSSRPVDLDNRKHLWRNGLLVFARRAADNHHEASTPPKCTSRYIVFRPGQLGYAARMPARLTHVFFDFTNTLVRVRGSVGEIYADVARRHGVSVAGAAVETHFSDAIASIPQPVAPGLTPDAIAQRERQWWRDVAQRTMQPFGDFGKFDAFFDEVFELFRHADAWELLPGLRETLDRLHHDGRALGVISDMDRRLHDAFDALELRYHFDIICLSFQTGYAKPDLRLYETAVRKAETAASHCVHIGDSITKDVEPALAAGLVAVHLAESDEQTPPRAHRIQSLTELPPLLQFLDHTRLHSD